MCPGLENGVSWAPAHSECLCEFAQQVGGVPAKTHSPNQLRNTVFTVHVGGGGSCQSWIIKVFMAEGESTEDIWSSMYKVILYENPEKWQTELKMITNSNLGENIWLKVYTHTHIHIYASNDWAKKDDRWYKILSQAWARNSVQSTLREWGLSSLGLGLFKSTVLDKTASPILDMQI